MNMGTVKWFNPQKGHGYIHPDSGGPNIFVHISAVESAGMNALKEGQRVIFENSARRADRQRVRRVVESAYVCNDKASRSPFRHNETFRHHFCFPLIRNVAAVAAVMMDHRITALERTCSWRSRRRGASRLWGP